MMNLSGRTALITGGARNLGKAIAETLGQLGSTVVITNRSSQDELDSTVSELQQLGVQAYGFQFDLSVPDSLPAFINSLRQYSLDIDILVNNVGFRPFKSFLDISLGEWLTVLNTNLTGPFLLTQQLVPHMIKNNWGRIINISGTDAFLGKPKRVHVVTTKAGIIGFTRSLAQEMARYSITVNCVVPGAFDTHRAPEWHPAPEVRYAALVQRIPLGRLGHPSELSPMVAFLASDEARYITGQAIHVNGGLFPTVRDPTDAEITEVSENSVDFLSELNEEGK
jgi:3-oxoacyl-[acyl-carrier protein] reductase